MSSPFSKNRGPVLKCKRDTHDLSFMNNLTMQMGYLYPCFVKEASAGDTWHINPAFGLRFLPTFFPLQTKIRAKLDFFYVRNRNLFDDWKNWRFGTGSPAPFPVLSQSETFEQSKTGSLGDYLGLPSTLVGSGQNVGTTRYYMPVSSANPVAPYSIFDSALKVSTSSIISNLPASTTAGNGRNNFVFFMLNESVGSFSDAEISSFPLVGSFYITSVQFTSEQVEYFKNGRFHIGIASYSSGEFTLLADISSASHFNSSCFLLIQDKSLLSGRFLVVWQTMSSSYDNIDAEFGIFPTWSNAVGNTGNAFNVVEFTSKYDKIPYSVSALPFRAYEQIYNAFYRDDRNNPFLVNGVYDPNKFIPTSSGGVDSTPYRLRRRNWEQDFLTSAVPNPQFGNAPLVGITSVSPSGVASLTLDDGSVVESKLEYDSNDIVTGFSTTRSVAANQSLINLASQGISINDLRAVNSLQKYLELHYRRGLRYRDQMMSHRGIEVGYDELDMPEFIGSVVQNVSPSQINQTSIGTDDNPLGSYAGQLSAVGAGSKLNKYCDEDGYIIGILSVVPVPCYSQLLPKHFTKINDPLEYFDPSFRNLGYQAIKYNEVCPLQAYDSGVSLDSTFGYNRAWYDYLQSQDEIHGQFRTTLNNFVLSRVFNSVPSLTPEFLTVNQDDLNQVFSISEANGTPLDVILGQVHFNVACERQVPAYAIPSL